MNMNKLFLLIMLTGACSVAHAAADNSKTVRIQALIQDPESGVFFLGEEVDAPLRGDTVNPTNIQVWVSLCHHIQEKPSLLTDKINLYDEYGNKIETICVVDGAYNTVETGPYDPDTTYFARSHESHIEIDNGLNIKGGDDE